MSASILLLVLIVFGFVLASSVRVPVRVVESVMVCCLVLLPESYLYNSYSTLLVKPPVGLFSQYVVVTTGTMVLLLIDAIVVIGLLFANPKKAREVQSYVYMYVHRRTRRTFRHRRTNQKLRHSLLSRPSTDLVTCTRGIVQYWSLP